jgi:peptide/nickel transport system ATP-binding protein
MSAPVIEVNGLKTHFLTRAGTVKSVDGISFHVNPGEVLGLVGESGSGKSVTGFSIMGLIDPPGMIVEGSIRLNGKELVGLDDEAMRRIRGREVAMIFQDPMMTLNPVLRIDTQMIETVLAHKKVSTEEARQRARDTLGMVGIPSPDERLKSYPHQFSGGMRQRVAIAIALLHEPQLIIADEPTTALDVSIQAQILAEMKTLAQGSGTALIWISHDLAIVSSLADRVIVLYLGRIVEFGPVSDVLRAPLHPYTRGLLDSLPAMADPGQKLRQIPGSTPSPLHVTPGCPFAPRCAHADDLCRSEPPTVGDQHHGAFCHHPLPAPA